MTERLTPGMLRDLADIWGRYLDTTQNTGRSVCWYYREEAARREAEAANSDKITKALAEDFVAEIGECPGSADVPKPTWPCVHGGECRTPAFCGTGYSAVCQYPKTDKPAPAAFKPCARCTTPTACVDEGCCKPAPAADNLPNQLRNRLTPTLSGAQRLRDLAADRIEALQARVARLTEALGTARPWLVLAGEDFGRDPTDDLAVIDAALTEDK